MRIRRLILIITNSYINIISSIQQSMSQFCFFCSHIPIRFRWSVLSLRSEVETAAKSRLVFQALQPKVVNYITSGNDTELLSQITRITEVEVTQAARLWTGHRRTIIVSPAMTLRTCCERHVNTYRHGSFSCLLDYILNMYNTVNYRKVNSVHNSIVAVAVLIVGVPILRYIVIFYLCIVTCWCLCS